jgi:ABC-type transporter Mla subunit MlaD
VVGTFANRRADIQHTLDVAPPALDGLRSGLNASTPLLDELAGLARNTTALTGPAPDAFNQTAALLNEAVPALHATSPLLQVLKSGAPPTTSLLTRIDPITRPATRALVSALPPLAELGRRSCDLGAFANNWRSMLGFGVAPSSSDPNFGLDSDEGLGAIDSTRLIVGLPPSSSTLGVDSTPAPAPGTDAYPGACLASQEHAP